MTMGRSERRPGILEGGSLKFQRWNQSHATDRKYFETVLRAHPDMPGLASLLQKRNTRKARRGETASLDIAKEISIDVAMVDVWSRTRRCFCHKRRTLNGTDLFQWPTFVFLHF